MPNGLILGIETSCDETAAAVVQAGARTLSSVVASQIDIHARYGGVVPELASREHLRAIVPVVRAALEQAHCTLDDLDAIAVTSGPGLAGALLVGITYAKFLAFARQLPLIAVNHLEGHIHAVLLNQKESCAPKQSLSDAQSQARGVDTQRDLKATAFSPSIKPASKGGDFASEASGEDAEPEAQSALALVVSGGHTHLYLARPRANVWSYKLIGRTLDDAAGEAYDKVAKLLGLPYPGGPWIDALARFGNPQAVPFTFAPIKSKLHLVGKTPRTKGASSAPIAALDPRFLFSFSGIKTAVLRYVELHGLRPATALCPQQGSATNQDVSLSVAESRLSEAQSRLAVAGSRRGAAGSRLCEAESSVSEAAGRLSDPEESSTEPSHLRLSPHLPEIGDIPQTKEQALALCPQMSLDLIASFQHAVVRDLLKKTFAAAESLAVTNILVTGGVAANRELRARFTEQAAQRNLRVAFPTLALSTDNAAMIAAAAWPRFLAKDFASLELSAEPTLSLGR